MDSMANKKLALLYILQILKEYSDVDHRLTQGFIAEKLEHHYGLVLERKAISRNLSLLKEAGFEIESTAKGNYLDDREFDDTELRLMIDGVLSSRYITEKQAKDLADRIAGLSSKYFHSHVKHIRLLSDHEKSENKTVFYTIQLIDEAIEAHKKISFDHSCYTVDRDHLTLGKSKRETVSPLQMVVKNQFYYLIAATERSVFDRKKKEDATVPVIKSYRLDMIFNPIMEDAFVVNPQRLDEYGQERDIKKLLSSNPYMDIHGSKPCTATFLCFPEDLRIVAENLGTDFRIMKTKNPPIVSECDTPEGKRELTIEPVKVLLQISINDLIEFACRYPEKIFITSPRKAVRRQRTLYENHLKLAEQMRVFEK